MAQRGLTQIILRSALVLAVLYVSLAAGIFVVMHQSNPLARVAPAPKAAAPGAGSAG